MVKEGVDIKRVWWWVVVKRRVMDSEVEEKVKSYIVWIDYNKISVPL